MQICKVIHKWCAGRRLEIGRSGRTEKETTHIVMSVLPALSHFHIVMFSANAHTASHTWQEMAPIATGHATRNTQRATRNKMRLWREGLNHESLDQGIIKVHCLCSRSLVHRSAVPMSTAPNGCYEVTMVVYSDAGTRTETVSYFVPQELLSSAVFVDGGADLKVMHLPCGTVMSGLICATVEDATRAMLMPQPGGAGANGSGSCTGRSVQHLLSAVRALRPPTLVMENVVGFDADTSIEIVDLPEAPVPDPGGVNAHTSMEMVDIELMKKDAIINCLKQFNPLPTLTGNKDDLAQRLYALSRAHSGTSTTTSPSRASQESNALVTDPGHADSQPDTQESLHGELSQETMHGELSQPDSQESQAMSALTATDAPVAPPLGQSAADMSVGMDENQPANSDTASENYSNTLAELIDSGMPRQDDDSEGAKRLKMTDLQSDARHRGERQLASAIFQQQQQLCPGEDGYLKP